MQSTSSNRELLKRLGIRLLITVSIFILLIYGLPIFLQLLSPFIFAFILAAIVSPLINTVNTWLNRYKITSKFPRNLMTFIVTIVILGVFAFIFYITFSILIREIVGLATSIQENWSSIVALFEDLTAWVTVQIDILPVQTTEMLENMTGNILEFIQNVSRNLLDFTVSTTGSIISRTGTFFLNALTFFLALYFMLADFNSTKQFIKTRTDKRLLNTAVLLKDSTLVAVGGFIRTQVIFAVITFIVFYTIFMLYGQAYALTLAVLLAIVDFIPLLGTIAVFVPWGMIEYIIGDPSKAIFLIFLGVIHFLFRRVTEPKVMGSQTGLHPLFALIGIYVGIEFSGLWGALLGPLVIIVIIGIFKSGILDDTLADLKELYYKIAVILQREDVE